MNMISLEGVSHAVVLPHGSLTILESITLEIKPGETVAITGASGSGKTTLMSLMAGLDQPSQGRIFLAGAELTAMTEDERARHRGVFTGFVFQQFHLMPGLTALENVMLPLELRGVRDANEQARAMLSRVGLSARGHHYPRQLSGGEQQRVALARAFVIRPKVLFADEPTGSLDAATGEQVMDLLFSLHQEDGSTLVLVTHEPVLAARCDRILAMEAGALLQERTA
jgi:putative ABC transport system ATP-binding protein